MSCRRKPEILRIRAKDVGRPGHHYLRIAVLRKKGKRGGRTVKLGRLRRYKRKFI